MQRLAPTQKKEKEKKPRLTFSKANNTPFSIKNESSNAAGVPLFLQREVDASLSSQPLIQRQLEEEDKDQLLQGKPMNIIVQREILGEEDEDITEVNSDPSLIQRQMDDDYEEFGDVPVFPKLTVGAPNDKYEQEADQVAVTVMQMPTVNDSQFFGDEEDQSMQKDIIRAKSHTPDYVQRSCPKCDEELEQATGRRPNIQMKSGNTFSPSQKVGKALKSPGSGSPLPKHVRSKVEPVLGSDLKHVKVHSDHNAAQAAKSINAKAFTHRNDVFLGEGQDVNNIGLMAHESAHVLQQAGPETQNRLFLNEDDQASTFIGSLASSVATAISIATHEIEIDALESESTSDQSRYKQIYNLHLKIAIIRLEEAARMARERGSSFFGRAVSGVCLDVSQTSLGSFQPFKAMKQLPIVTHKAFDDEFWDFKPDCDAGEAKLFQKKGTPSQAIDRMFKKLGTWTFDCAEYLQVARWYALRHTIGEDAFNARMTKLGGLDLKPHGSTGIVTNETFVRDNPWAKFYRKNNIKYQMEISDKTETELLDTAPIGTRVTFTNSAAPTGGGWWTFGNHNTIKMGDNSYASHPFGTLKRDEIECRQATWGYIKELKETGKKSIWEILPLEHQLYSECKKRMPRELIREYIYNNIYISRLEFFNIY